MPALLETACVLRRKSTIPHVNKGGCVDLDKTDEGDHLCKKCKEAHPYMLMEFQERQRSQFPDRFYQKGIAKLRANWQPKTALPNGRDYHCASRQKRFRDSMDKEKDFIPKLMAARQLRIKDANKLPGRAGVPENHLDRDEVLCTTAEGPDMICALCAAAVASYSDKEGTANLKDFFVDGKKTLTDDVIKRANEQAT